MNENLFKALGNVTRVKILACLGDEPKNVTGLIDRCDLSQSAVSQHLMYLRRAGLIKCERKGREQIYTVVDLRLSEICRELLQVMINI